MHYSCYHFELTKTHAKRVLRPFRSTLCGQSRKGREVSAGKGGAWWGGPMGTRWPGGLRSRPPAPRLTRAAFRASALVDFGYWSSFLWSPGGPGAGRCADSCLPGLPDTLFTGLSGARSHSVAGCRNSSQETKLTAPEFG